MAGRGPSYTWVRGGGGERPQTAGARLPAVVSLFKETNEPRYPSFMGIRKAQRVEIPVWSAGEIGLSGPFTAALAWPEVYAPPRVETGCEIITGDTPEQIANRLAERLIEEKVI